MSIQSPAHTDRKSARRPRLDHETAMRLAEAEYRRVIDLLGGLTPEQWATETDCPGWDVRAMAGHMLGMIQMVASVPELMRQQMASTRAAKQSGGLLIDALTALQVEKNDALTATELVDEIRRLAPRAVKNRRRAPALIRNQTMNDESDGWWTFGYLFDVILTRDPFMHRIDITRATGVPMVATAEHEGILVDDVVREWAGRHRSPYDLELTGPAGGRWQEQEGERLTMDAFEFCRTVGGRAPATGLLTTQVPF
jgi:uncharacterized protein (TIGR03083 family)